jgi:hypothetical protein
MENLLLKHRKEFREEFNKYLPEDAKEPTDLLIFLTVNHEKIERMHRRTTLLEKIKNKGLEKYSEKIIDDMNKTIRTMNDAQKGYASQTNKIPDNLLSNSDYALIYGLDYIDKWKMYNKLFGTNQ